MRSLSLDKISPTLKENKEKPIEVSLSSKIKKKINSFLQKFFLGIVCMSLIRFAKIGLPNPAERKLVLQNGGEWHEVSAGDFAGNKLIQNKKGLRKSQPF